MSKCLIDLPLALLWVYRFDGWVTVKAEIVCLGVDLPYSFAVHNALTLSKKQLRSKWTVTNIETGCAVSRQANSKNEAIKMARLNVKDKKAEDFQQIIRNLPNEVCQ